MMKRSLLILLAVALCLALLTACSNQKAPAGANSLYYCHTEYQYGVESGVVNCEYYKPPASASIEQILQRYLKGPESKDLVSPFPANTKLVSIELKDNKAQITFTKELAECSNIDLTSACASITLSVRDITGYTVVDIRAQDALLNNQKSIVMNAEELNLSDILSSSP